MPREDISAVNDYVGVASVGDEIVSKLTGNHYTVVGVNYDNSSVNATSLTGERYLFSFDGFKDGAYKKV